MFSLFRELTQTGAGKVNPAAKLKPFLDLVISLKRDLPVSIPLLRDLADMANAGKTTQDTGPGKGTGLLKRRIERRYLRLCRNQEELGRLNLKEASPGSSPEDYIFSQIDFSRYRKMDEKYFELFFPEGLEDFGDYFLKNFFDFNRGEILKTIEESYEKTEGLYKIQKETPLVLSIMRTLETSLENLDLFCAGEINGEVKNLWTYVSGRKNQKLPPGAEKLYRSLVLSMDNTLYTHEDGMSTKFFISSKGDLSGTFRPGGKPWTLVLIANSALNIQH